MNLLSIFFKKVIIIKIILFINFGNLIKIFYFLYDLINNAKCLKEIKFNNIIKNNSFIKLITYFL